MHSSRYKNVNGRIVKCGREGMICGNRPIYCANTYTSILAGDLPVIRLINRTKVYGTLRFYVNVNDNEKKYFHDFEHITFSYHPNIIEWTLSDKDVAGEISMRVGAPDDVEGFVVEVSSSVNYDIFYSYGDFCVFPNQNGSCKEGWNICAQNTPELKVPFPTIDRETISVKNVENGLLISGIETDVFFTVPDISSASFDEYNVYGHFAGENNYQTFSCSISNICKYDFSSVITRHKNLSEIFYSESPNKELDTSFNCLSAEIDGAWKSPLTDHGNFAYVEPLLGWCNRFGNALGGWNERCSEELNYYVKYQSRSNLRDEFLHDKKHLDTIAGRNSRFYGKGHINKNQHMYNMQSQFFDQMIFAWRMFDDADMAKILYKALKLHTSWQDECFDPDSDGLYESYINTWPTDSVWYNGGGSCEETCYAYRSHLATMELAAKYGDIEEFDFHKKILERIKKAFFEKLWLKNEGYPAMVREKGFYERLHKSAWLYNCFLPVDVGITDALQSATCLWYSKWGLENVRQELGGRMVWMSNWVPSIWSVRKLSAGENFQLAYSFFKAGFPEDGFDVLEGSLLSGTYNSDIPASISSEGSSLMARTVICGLHGYEPDYPNKKVIISPCYPKKWKYAKIKTKYFSASYKKNKKGIKYSFDIKEKADVEIKIQLPVCKIISVDGIDNYSIEPGFSCLLLKAKVGNVSRGDINVEYCDEIDVETEISKKIIPGVKTRFTVDNIVSVKDIQDIIAVSQVNNNSLDIITENISGTHIVFAECKYYNNTYYQILRLEIAKTKEEILKNESFKVDTNQGVFLPISVAEFCNSAVQNIFKQKYYSPFTDVNRLSIGNDGYSPWTFTFWKTKPPKIKLAKEFEKKKILHTENNVPFLWNGKQRNVAFTSLWSNWQSEVTFPINEIAKAVHFLVAGSTNPMQCGIENAELVIKYETGEEEKIGIVNPDNFWSICGYGGDGLVFDQGGSSDYDYNIDSFCLPERTPEIIQLGENCRACVISYRLCKKRISSITLRTLSQEVVIGLCAMTLQK